MSLNVVIIEDEPHAARKLERRLTEIETDINLLAHLQTVDEAISWLPQNNPDLIFLDIHLGDALSFEIFEKVKIDAPIIFTTAYDEYAIQAFKLNSIDYLLKPIKKQDLQQALDKFNRNRLSQQSIDVQKLLTVLQPSEKPEFQKRFMIYSGEKIKTIAVEEVAYFFAEGKYCYLITKDNLEHLIDFTLDKLEKVLDPEQFFRINRQFIIAFDAIKDMYSFPKGRVKIDLIPRNKKEAIVSVERSPDFKRWLNR